MSEPRTIDRCFAAAFQNVVVENLERWAIIAVTGQSQMCTAQMRTRNARPCLEFFTTIVAFRRDRDTPKDSLVEIG